MAHGGNTQNCLVSMEWKQPCWFGHLTMAGYSTTLTEDGPSKPIVSTDGDTSQITGAFRFHWIMAALLATGFALCYGLDSAVTLDALRVLPNLAPLAIVAGYSGWAGHKRICDLISVFLWALAVMMLSSPLVLIAGASRFPLVDESLRRFDVVSTGVIVGWVQARPGFQRFSAVAYGSMLPLLIGAVSVPALLRRRRAAYRFVLAGTLASFVTVATFARFPAAGPWTVENYHASKAQTQVASQLTRLKAHIAVEPGEKSKGGIVSFPSFHTILAILCAFALGSIRWARWPAVVLASGVCVATVTTGWHYGIDVIAGVVVALVCQGLATGAIGTRKGVAAGQ